MNWAKLNAFFFVNMSLLMIGDVILIDRLNGGNLLSGFILGLLTVLMIIKLLEVLEK